MVNIQTITTNTAPKRKTRTPAFPMAGTLTPFGLYPVMGHMVLPGETLQSASFKMRHTSLPLASPNAGAWLESWLVYFKLTDLDEDLKESFISDDMSTSGYTAAGDGDRYFQKAGDIEWIKMCTKKFYESYFRHETEPLGAYKTIDGVPQVKLNNRSWYQNMMYKDADAAVPVNDASDLYKHLQDYQILQQMGMVEMTYEKYIESYGVSNFTEKTDPEILRFSKSWTLPSNVIEPTTGTPTSAWLWNDEIKMEKAKRFKEPGFVMLFQCVRPKMYQANIQRSMLGDMWGFSDWFPIYTVDDPTAGVKEMATDSTIFTAASRTDPSEKTMIYDQRDLLMHGEQFINNFSPPYDLPMSTGLTMEDDADPEDLRGEYATSGDVDNLFTGASPNLWYEGMGFMTISGHVVDHTPL